MVSYILTVSKNQHLCLYLILIFSNLMASQYFLVDFICQFKLEYYPFDDQMCEAVIEMTEKDKHYVRMIPAGLKNMAATDIMTYILKDVSISEKVTTRKTLVLNLLNKKIYREVELFSSFTLAEELLM